MGAVRLLGREVLDMRQTSQGLWSRRLAIQGGACQAIPPWLGVLFGALSGLFSQPVRGWGQSAGARRVCAQGEASD